MTKKILLLLTFCALFLQSKAATVYFDDSNKSWGQVYAYCWTDSNNNGIEAMTYDSSLKLWHYTTDYENIIFLNQSSWNNQAQTADLVVADNAIYTGNESKGSTGTSTLAEWIDGINGGYTYYFRSDLDSSGTWTSKKMNYESGVGFTYTFTHTSGSSFFSFSTDEDANNWDNVWRPEGDQSMKVTANGSFSAASGSSTWYITTAGTYTVTISLANVKTFTITGFSDDSGNTGDTGGSDVSEMQPTGTLPVLYINIGTRNDDGSYTYDDEIISKDLQDKDYRDGYYYLTVPEGSGFSAVGSEDEPLPLEMKARGNYTRTGFAKKPFKLKLGTKQNLLNMNVKDTKSKHWAILAGADDDMGFLRNYVGFNLGARIGLPWTPTQQPVEVVINGDYRGLYFLTESIRVGDGRLQITELEDEETDQTLLSGGYLVELDNYKTDANTIVISDNGPVYVTPDTPEVYSTRMKRFITETFTTLNNLAGANSAAASDDLWNYIELDDAARYYLVMEIIGHTEAFHGSTYLYRDFGLERRWHFSPLWDCGHAFEASGFFYNDAPYGCTWIGQMRQNEKFNAKVQETWKWFMSNNFEGIIDEIDQWADNIAAAAAADWARWGNAELPVQYNDPLNGNAVTNPTAVSNNSDMAAKKTTVKNYLTNRINYLSNQFGSYDTSNPTAEPERVGDTGAAALPSYMLPDAPSAYNYTIYVYDAEATGTVSAWIWDDACDSGKNIYGESWPGTMTFTQKTGADGSTYHELNFELEREMSTNPGVIIIHNNAQSDDKVFEDGAWYDLSGETVSYDPSQELEFDTSKQYVFVYDDANWGNVNLYIYNSVSDIYSSWPGVKLPQYSSVSVQDASGNIYTGLYYFEVPESYTNGLCIFSNNGNSSQRYPGENEPGMELDGRTMLYLTSSGSTNGWIEVSIYEEPDPWSGTLPLFKITLPDESASWTSIGYGDAGAVKNCVVELDPLDTGEEAVNAENYAGCAKVTIKGRGADTWDSYEKKSYKLKFDKKVPLLGIPKSKHYLLMPYCNDAAYGLLTNYAGHRMAYYIGMEWSALMQPVELVINDEYLGLYFVVENVRAAADRVQINDYGDTDDTTGNLVYDLENDFLVEFNSNLDVTDGAELYYTFDVNNYTNKLYTSTPSLEDINDALTAGSSAAQSEIATITEALAYHMTLVADVIDAGTSNPMTDTWSHVIDAREAARFYVVQEIMDDINSFDTNFYMHHTGSGRWLMGPVWDFSGAFSSQGNKSSLIHERDEYKGTFIKDLYANKHFLWYTIYTFQKFRTGSSPRSISLYNVEAIDAGNARTLGAAVVADIVDMDTFDPEMNGAISNVKNDVTLMAEKIAYAAEADAVRWSSSTSVSAATSDDNYISQRADQLNANIDQAINYLNTTSAQGGAGWTWQEATTGIGVIGCDPYEDSYYPVEYFDMMGRRLPAPVEGGVTLRRQGSNVTKIVK